MKRTSLFSPEGVQNAIKSPPLVVTESVNIKRTNPESWLPRGCLWWVTTTSAAVTTVCKGIKKKKKAEILTLGAQQILKIT